MSVCCECCVSSRKGLWNELITRPEESYRLWYVVVCDLETSRMRRPWPTGGCCAKRKNTLAKTMLFIVDVSFSVETYIYIYILTYSMEQSLS